MTRLHGQVIVCGLNDVGLRIIEQLHLAGEQVMVVYDGAEALLSRIVESLGVPRIVGDPRRPATLEQAGVAQAAALICAEDTDLRNLEIALLVQDLWPDLRLVVQLSNTAVGRAVRRLGGSRTVLDVATLAAPAFVEATLSSTEHVLDIGGQRFTIASRVVERASDLRSTFGDLAPIAVVPAAGGELQVCPGRDLPIRPGDEVTLIGTPDDLAGAAGIAANRAPTPHHERLPRLRRIYRLSIGFVREAERPLRVTPLILLSVALLSVILLMLGYRGENGQRMGLLDAVYFTTETLTTVGFGDFVFAHQHDWLRIWAIVLMIVGALLVTILYAMLTNMLVTRRLAATAGRRQAHGMRDHVILIGLGSVGLRVMEALVGRGQGVIVLENDEHNRFLPRARELGVPVIIGDSTIGENLRAANLASCRGVAVLTSNDLVNIETGLAVDDLLDARAVDVPVVLRVFDRQLAATIERHFNFHNVRSTAALAAPWFVGAALGLTVLHTFYVSDTPFLVGRLTVAASGGLRGQTMAELSGRTRVVAIRRLSDESALEYPPRRDTRFRAGDQAWVVGPYGELLALLQHESG